MGDLAPRRHRQARRRAEPGGAGQRPGGRRPAAAARGPPPRRARQPRPAVRARPTRCATPRCRCSARVAPALFPAVARDHDRAPGPRADHPRPAAPGLRRPHARAVRLLVRVLPPLHRRPRRDRPAGARHVRHRGQGARPRSRRWASTSSTCRRSTRSARCTARARNTARARRQPDAQPGDVGSPWAIGSAEGGHDAIDPELGTIEDFDAFVARAPTTSAWRSRSTSRCSARRTTRGSPRTRSGSPCAPTARSPTRRTRRRSTRTSTRSTSTTTPRASTPSRCGWCCTGSSTACGSSGWTTRTPSRRTSGTG